MAPLVTGCYRAVGHGKGAFNVISTPTYLTTWVSIVGMH